MKRLKVAVVYGGRSAEHNVSVHSAENVAALVEKAGHEVLAVYVAYSGKWFLKDSVGGGESGREIFPWLGSELPLRDSDGNGIAVDVFFPIIHGSMGEDGTIQGLLELLGAAYVGCGVLASAAGMDKQLSKQLAVREGLPVLPDVVLEKTGGYEAAAQAFAEKAGYPVFVKPVCLGSSVGISKVDSLQELVPALDKAFLYDSRVMVEKGVDHARELCCGLLGIGAAAQTTPCAEIHPKNHDFFDYDAKYLDPNGFELLIPVQMPSELETGLRKMAAKFFGALGGYGFARVDFFLSQDGKSAYFGEINTAPGFTSHSLYPSLCKHAGMDMPAVVSQLLELAL
ncbi:MAG TPA: D-alanine--D-alanine ligase family protein, partial [Elusimicrobiales bacterium]|nr:D-alanine--D-alanine ligase family protein [Elusimicrobiales bacterium]